MLEVMNFLLHRHLALRQSRDPGTGIGAMLPDLWRMADRRVRPCHELADGELATPVMAGIAHHLDADRWFHRTNVFLEGERRLSEGFRSAGFAARRMGLLAHIAWELCLDGALVQREGLEPLLDGLRRDLAAHAAPCAAAVEVHHFSVAGRTVAERQLFEVRMERLTTELARGPWIGRYASAEGLAEVLGAIRMRVGLSPLDEGDQARLASALGEVRASASDALGTLLTLDQDARAGAPGDMLR
jgi:hypothetical protein